MGRLLVRVSVACFILIAIVSVGGLVYLSQAINLVDEPPQSPVVGLPAEVNLREPVDHYRGPHPRVAGRPAETFNFPIPLGETGPVNPLFAGPLEYPFLCGHNGVTYSQPLVDNHQGYGVPVFARDEEGVLTDEIVGYSLHCSQPTQASYFYNREGTQEFYPLEEANDDIAMIEVDGREVPFVLRLETGTINRFHYIIAALRGSEESIDKPNPDHWNKKLIYRFRGGVGIGKRQGKIRASDVLRRGFDQLQMGYAMVYSTANQTSNHYDMWLAEDTAARVKRQFVGLYGEPVYTVGIGGSGGAIQQYLFAQNHPGLLDAIIPLYSYPDMITQTINVLDCEPLEYYFDVTDGEDPRWDVWENRSWIQGMNADSQARNRFTQLKGLADLLNFRFPEFTSGASECIKGWRGLTQLVYNPTFIHFESAFAPEIADQVHWTHWDNLKNFYGVDKNGYANNTWDNVGVQYGLEALKEGQITPADFLHLNRHVGGWKDHPDFQNERLWLLTGKFFPVDLSFWSEQNMKHAGAGAVSPRTEGSLAAMEGAYRSGHVFIGQVDVPIIDARHYLEEELDMHHSTASFDTRLRLQKGQGHADNQVIWMADKRYDPINDALAVVDEWMANIRRHPERSVADNKPASAQDLCMDGQGEVIAQGGSVWDGDWNGRPTGACMAVYPRYKTSREVAGAGPTGDLFKCHLQPVDSALANGVYGEVDMRPYRDQLAEIFPTGVCDYRMGDLARPADLLRESEQYAELPAELPGAEPSRLSRSEESQESGQPL
ncbi:hypothetical protein F6455_10040 [Proteobacteria bacterium 005FR1]|nr:hypothetical protein [Proteobacteria bacterium 005FR1]